MKNFELQLVNKAMSKESEAISLLKRAVECDSEKEWVSALEFYKNGTQALMEAIRTGNFLKEKEQKSNPNSGVLQFAKNWVC